MANISTPKIARIRAALTSLHFRTPSRGGGFAGAMDDLDQWFAEQILPYEGALTAYLRRVWPDPSEIADLRQEVMSASIRARASGRSEEHTSELQSLMRISYAVFCLKKKNKTTHAHIH